MAILEFKAEIPAGQQPQEQNGLERPRRLGAGAVLGAAVALAAVYSGGPAPLVEPPKVDFGMQEVSAESGSQRVTLTNSGSAPLHVRTVELAGDLGGDFHLHSQTCEQAPLEEGKQCVIEVGFIPRGVGGRSAKLRITDDAPDSPQEATLLGLGTEPPDLRIRVSGDENFGEQEVRTQSAEKEITIENPRASVLRITQIVPAGGSTDEFAITREDCTRAPLASHAVCTIQLRFAPRVEGVREFNLSIFDDTRDDSHMVTLRGIGTLAKIRLNPSPLEFDRTELGRQTGVEAVTLTSEGSAALRVSKVSIAGPQEGDYQLRKDACSGARLAPGQNCTVGISFAPQGAGSRVAALSIYDSATGGSREVQLHGTGIAAAMEVKPSSLDFLANDRRPSTRTQTVTVTSGGTAPLRLGGIRLQGPGQAEFRIVDNRCENQTLSAGTACTVEVAFVPSGSPGTRSATLVIPNSTTANLRTVPLYGARAKPLEPQIRIDPPLGNFGNQAAGRARVGQTFTLASTGQAPLQIGSVGIGGASEREFRIVRNTCNAELSPGSACAVTVVFTPLESPGQRRAWLLVNDNVAGSPQQVPLLATSVVLAAGILADPESGNFAPQQFGGSGQTLPITVRSTGSLALQVSGLRIEGSNSGDFGILQNDCNRPLQRSDACTVLMIFRPGGPSLTLRSLIDRRPTLMTSAPPGAQERSATLMISNNASGSPLGVPLRGVLTFRTPPIPPSKPPIEPPSPSDSGQPASGGAKAAGAANRIAAGALVVERPRPVVTVDPRTYEFSRQLMATESKPQSFGVTNAGTLAVDISRVAIVERDRSGAVIRGGPSNFIVGGTNCPNARLAPQRSCTVSVYFRPQNALSYRAEVVILDSQGNALASAQLGGTGMSNQIIR
jgi:hypothetical protein